MVFVHEGMHNEERGITCVQLKHVWTPLTWVTMAMKVDTRTKHDAGGHHNKYMHVRVRIVNRKLSYRCSQRISGFNLVSTKSCVRVKRGQTMRATFRLFSLLHIVSSNTRAYNEVPPETALSH
jgi:hypothetical protein